MAWRDLFRRRALPSAHTAAVQPLSVLSTRAYRRFRQARQDRAVFFARRLGLSRFAAGLLADSGARCLIRPEFQTRPGDPRSWEPVNSQLHAQILGRYRNETQELADLVRLRIWHDQVAGECLQVRDVDDRGRTTFRIRSTLQADFSGRGVLIREIAGGMPGDGTAKWFAPEAIRRLWNPDEEEPLLAQSPTMAVLEDLERYWALHRATRRRAESALAMNGILWTPTGAHQSLPLSQQVPGVGPQPGTKLERDYYELSKRSLEDDDAVSSFVPPLWSWHHEFGKPEYVKIDNALDPNALAFRKEAVEDIARGMNYPARLLVSGAGDGNHWSDWLMEEQFARSSLAPILERVLWRDLSESYYRPALRALQAQGLFPDDPARYRVGFDMTPVVVHPDQSARSIELYKLALLGYDTVLEANGYDIDDLPTTEELERWLKVQEVLGAQAKFRLERDGATTSQGPPQQRALTAAAVGPHERELVGWLDV